MTHVSTQGRQGFASLAVLIDDALDTVTAALQGLAWELELHIQQVEVDAETVVAGIPTANVLPLTSIRWVVFKSGVDIEVHRYFGSRESTHIVDALLTRLPRLEKVVFETGFDGVHDVTSIAALLPGVADKTHLWSRKQAHEYARDAHERGLPASEQMPISPWWYAAILRPSCN